MSVWYLPMSISPDSGTYTVVITNAFGAVTSAPVMLNVIPAVERRPVPGINLMGETGSSLNVEYTESLGPTPNWLPLDTVNLTNPPQYYFRCHHVTSAATVLSGLAGGNTNCHSVAESEFCSSHHIEWEHRRSVASGLHQPVRPDGCLGDAGYGYVDQHVAALL